MAREIEGESGYRDDGDGASWAWERWRVMLAGGVVVFFHTTIYHRGNMKVNQKRARLKPAPTFATEAEKRARLPDKKSRSKPSGCESRTSGQESRPLHLFGWPGC